MANYNVMPSNAIPALLRNYSSSRKEIKCSRISHGDMKQYNSASHDHTAVPFMGIDEHVLN
jgi:hypothetical protein